MSPAKAPVDCAGMRAVSDDDIAAAQDILDGVTRVTPLLACRALADLIGGPAHFKCENLQRTGSFKIRGAYVRISRLGDDEKRAGIVAASAGNHAQGVALAARLQGLRATVFMPTGASLAKLAATTAYGADVRLVGDTVDEALAAARSYAMESGGAFVHPFDHPDVIAGQATVGAEILRQWPDVRTIVVATGGGGLLAGVTSAIRARKPDVRVVGVQAEGAAAWAAALQAGQPVSLGSMNTVADGIAVGRPGDVPFAILRDHADIVTVSEEALSQALLLCLERSKLVVEPAGVASVAAVMDSPTAFESPVVCVLSGGNIDPLVLLHFLRHGMAVAGRFLRLQLRLPDLPGALAQLLLILAERGANVLDVEHVRTAAALDVTQAEVVVQLETRGAAHVQELLDTLREAGYFTTPF